LTKLKLETFEKRITVRPLRAEDYEQVIAIQAQCFPGMKPWMREQFDSQLEHFPQGQCCVEYRKKIVASGCSLVVDFDEYSSWHSWQELSDNGYITNHDPEGDTLYGIEIMVHPKFRGMKLARRIYEYRKQVCRELNLARIIIGGRIPGYGKHADEMSAREYVDLVAAGRVFDQVLTPQLANRFVLKGLFPDYFPTDSDSRGYATFLEWTNLDYVPESHHRLQRVSLVRLCAVQYQMRWVDTFEEFERQCSYFVDTASDAKSDFVLFPELLTTQLLTTVESKRPAEAARQLAELTPRYLELFTGLAIRYNVNIIGGSQFAVEDGELRNVSYLFRRDGTIGRQYKIHVTPAERRWWGVRPGSKVEVFETDRGKVAILLCYDVEFPELARIAAGRGAQILFVPFNTDNREGYMRVRYCAQARAVENDVFVVISGCTGNLPFVANADVHYAQSGIFTPLDFSFDRDGIAAECTPNIETLVIHDVDLELLRRHRHTGTVRPWSDRRPDLYGVVYREKPGEDEKRI
jgi:predicted amidohydrolase/ribosomal protein S18 acetylase RimI-like enzyme